MASKLTIDLVPLEAVDDVAGWDEAVRSTDSPVFYSRAFLKCIATAPLLETDSSELLVLSDENGFAAGVPVFRQRRLDAIRHLAPLYDTFANLATSSGLAGHCWHCYDSRIVSPRPGARLDRLVDALAARARAVGADYFGLVNVADPLTLQAMDAAGIAPRHMVDRYVMDIGSYARFDDYLAALRPDARRELSRQYRHYEASAAELAIERHPFDDVGEIVRLCRATAARYDAEFYYPDEPLRLLLAQEPSVRLISIRIGGERIGVVICFFDPPKLHVWAAGMRYDRSAFSPYAIGIAEAIAYAIREGMTMIEGGRGNGRIKLKQGFVPRRLYACLRGAAS
ncbi:MAG: GNAT family N-acetyltransferase [Candidatus Eremiobacteraeota bacterium]|nr:GNAT family N-acetyltransferase [Candidatus Eremiobacteraeota bacterium]